MFTTVPKFPYERDEFVLLSLEGALVPGRWLPGDGGSDWLQLPGLLIELTEETPYQILGLVVPFRQHRWNSTIIPRASWRGIIDQPQLHWFIIALIVVA